MNNFWQRILTGSVFTGSIVAAIWWGPLPFVLLFLLAALLSLNEFYSLLQNEGLEINRQFGMFCGLLMYLMIAIAFLLVNSI
ncbi:MAG: phosphatidate cytidylyltransferase [Bacteroidetes bacterium]|nr:phosphatidate cytidylyltransferase [Bacteroidota bacterium]